MNPQANKALAPKASVFANFTTLAIEKQTPALNKQGLASVLDVCSIKYQTKFYASLITIWLREPQEDDPQSS